MSLNFELAPKPGTTLKQRREEFNNVRFVAIRNLATQFYKKSDGSPFMAYTDTLADRADCIEKVLEYELTNGLIVNDGTTATDSQNTTGPEMNQTPTVTPAPVLTVQTVPIVPVNTTQAADVSVSSPKPSRRKAAQAGASVAPPPAPAPTQVVTQAEFTPVVQPETFVVPVQTQSAPATFQVPQPGPVGQPGIFDVTPLLQRIDLLGTGIQVAATNSDQCLKELAAIRNEMFGMIAVLHHMYAANPQLAPAIAGVKNLAEFRQYLSRFVGSPQ